MFWSRLCAFTEHTGAEPRQHRGRGPGDLTMLLRGKSHQGTVLAKVLGTGHTDQRAWCPVLCPWEDGLCPAEWEWPAGHRLT